MKRKRKIKKGERPKIQQIGKESEKTGKIKKKKEEEDKTKRKRK